MRSALWNAFHIVGIVSTVFAQSPNSDLSFGQTSPLSPNGANIAGFEILGEGHVPRLMSDRVILTPPHPGNKRGALWAENKNTATDWKVELDFRVGGPERAGGNLQLWYVDSGKALVSLSSIYTVQKFDGLAVVIDTHGGTSGSIRGFLNDGSKDYRNDPNVDALAFGHCNYAYRNLGRSSKITVKSSPGSGLEVLIDERPCFSSDKISLPLNYHFGITAASSDPPDSFEVFKLSTYSTSSTSPSSNTPPQTQDQAHQTQSPPQRQTQPPANEAKDTDPETYTTSLSQFTDLHNRLQLLSHAVSNLFREISTHTQTEEERYTSILSLLNPLTTTLTNLDHRMQNIELMVSALKSEMERSDHPAQFARLREGFEIAHGRLPELLERVVRAAVPRLEVLAAVVVFVQLVLVAGWVVWKRKRSGDGSGKKYL